MQSNFVDTLRQGCSLFCTQYYRKFAKIFFKLTYCKGILLFLCLSFIVNIIELIYSKINYPHIYQNLSIE